ncbi:MAG: hypothetical protein HZY75_13265 [Nocardioidaceae bacterium]|nr:MAG: hypothetical protein HZY75_13265 [Nocardioidaceae bacterium]
MRADTPQANCANHLDLIDLAVHDERVSHWAKREQRAARRELAGLCKECALREDCPDARR